MDEVAPISAAPRRKVTVAGRSWRGASVGSNGSASSTATRTDLAMANAAKWFLSDADGGEETGEDVTKDPYGDDDDSEDYEDFEEGQEGASKGVSPQRLPGSRKRR